MTTTFELPESALARCVVCERPIRETSRLVLHEVVGFERDRSQGGTNHVIARRRTGRMVGSCCAERVRAGTQRQEALL